MDTVKKLSLREGMAMERMLVSSGTFRVVVYGVQQGLKFAGNDDGKGMLQLRKDGKNKHLLDEPVYERAPRVNYNDVQKSYLKPKKFNVTGC